MKIESNPPVYEVVSGGSFIADLEASSPDQKEQMRAVYLEDQTVCDCGEDLDDDGQCQACDYDISVHDDNKSFCCDCGSLVVSGGSCSDCGELLCSMCFECGGGLCDNCPTEDYESSDVG